jgi:hypothetical protein
VKWWHKTSWVHWRWWLWTYRGTGCQVIVIFGRWYYWTDSGKIQRAR